MTASQSKYAAAARDMDEALVELLLKKDYEYLTVKEICQRAGVNRSTFYLHYDGVDDLLQETIQSSLKSFFSCFPVGGEEIQKRIASGPLESLVLINEEFLCPYLSFIKDHASLFRVACQKPQLFHSQEVSARLKANVLEPIYARFGVAKVEWPYLSAYYENGVISLVLAWLKRGCQESIDEMVGIVLHCIRPNFQ